MDIRRIGRQARWLVLLALLLGLPACDDDWYNDWDLEGIWEISEIDLYDVPVYTYQVFLNQDGNTVEIVRGSELLTTGFISGDIIYCDDWYGYDISRVYIDSDYRMHSERPDNGELLRIDFRRIY